MRRLTALALTFSLLAVACQWLTPQPAPVSPTPPEPSLPDENLPFRVGLTSGAQPVLEQLDDASRYELDLVLADDLLHLDGQGIIHYTNTENVPLHEIQLRLFPNLLGGEMTVSNLRVDEADVTPRFGLNNSLLIVPLRATLESGQRKTHTMDILVSLPSSL